MIRDCPLQNQSEGTPNGPITQYFGDFEYNPDDGPYEAIDHAWTCTFRFEYSDIQKEALVTGGQYSIRMVYTYLTFFAKLPAMEANGRLNMMYVHCVQLQELLEKVVPAASRNHGTQGEMKQTRLSLKLLSQPAKQNTEKGLKRKWVSSDEDEEFDNGDGEYEPGPDSPCSEHGKDRVDDDLDLDLNIGIISPYLSKGATRRLKPDKEKSVVNATDCKKTRPDVEGSSNVGAGKS
ncbi:hypothetical protein K439DRAFT_1619897 [Ramaria rubella]|nr:hypothetical protein K439DRAFT_1619897 [Ramaria rubella]